MVAAIIPWNFPVGLACGKIGPALMAGNTIVVKVPEFSPLATLECLAAVAAVFPPGVLNIVSGFGPEVGSALVKDRRVRKVAFVGSTETGKAVMADAASHLASVTLELGGNDAALVLDDAELDEPAIHVSSTARSPTPARSALPSSGSSCTSRATTSSSRNCRPPSIGSSWVTDHGPR